MFLQTRVFGESSAPRLRQCLSLVIALGAWLFGTGPAGAQTGPSYSVQVNTLALSGSSGYFQFSFDPGTLSGSLAATAALTQFTLSGGALNPGAPFNATTGAVSGTLGGTLSIADTDPGSVNGLLQGLTFGSGFSFNVAFSGPAFNKALTSTSSSDFAVSLFDASGNPLLSGAPGGELLDISVAPNAVVTTQTYRTSTGGPPVASVGPLAPPGGGAVPEAGTLCLLLLGGLGAAVRGAHARRRGTTDHGAA